MSDWPLVKLNEIVEITSSKRVKRADYVDEGVPFFRSKEVIERSKGNDISTELFITEEHFQKIFTKFGAPEVGDILLTSVGTLGVPYQVQADDRFYFKDGNLTWFRNFKDTVNPKFLYYWLTSPVAKRKFDEVTIGSTQKALTIVALKSLELNLPPSEIQNQIVEMLDSLDGKLANNRQTNQTLEQIAQAIFKSWFVDFEPVKAKAFVKEKDGNELAQSLAAQAIICGVITLDQLQELENDYRGLEAQLHPLITKLFPNEIGLDYWSPETLQTTAALFPDALVESELGEIPEGWRYSEIGNEVTVVGGGTPSTKNTDFWEGGHIHWTTPRDMSNLTDKILLDTDRKITEAGLAKISSGLLPNDTVLMSSRAPVGYLAVAKVPVAINQGYIAMKCESGLTPEYVVQWAESVMDEIKQRASGTTFAEISKKNFKIIPIVVPIDNVIGEYTKVASGLYSKITEGMRETKYLMDIRDTLLPKLLSGELELAGQMND